MTVEAFAPEAEVRADRLLQDVLGPERYARLRYQGFIDIPSRARPGRTYRLDGLGNLSYRDPGEQVFVTGLCVEPDEAIPRDDQVAMRYLLVTGDEEGLLRTANPITFGITTIARAMRHDLGKKHPAWLAGLLTAAILGGLVACVGLEVWAILGLGGAPGWLRALVVVLCILPALGGGVLIAAALVEAGRSLRSLVVRLRGRETEARAVG